MYIGLYGSGLFNFRSYVNLPTLFACFLGFDIPTSSFIFIENVFIILVCNTNGCVYMYVSVHVIQMCVYVLQMSVYICNTNGCVYVSVCM